MRTPALLVPSAATTLLGLAPVLLRAGWPHNHEHLAFAFRTFVWSAHLGRGDVLPIWSAEDVFGLGSPMPLFYHKLFYALSGTLHVFTGSMKFSLVAAVALLLLTGCTGLFTAATRLGLSRGTAAVVAAALPLQTYTQVNWLVRGAMAEFSACMIVPWLIAALLILVQERRVSFLLPASLFALALAHSVLALFGGVAVVAAWAICAAVPDRRGIGRITLRLAAAGGAVAVLLSPWFLAWLALRGTFDPSVLSAGSYHPDHQFRPFLAEYLSPWPWAWGRDWKALPLELRPATSLFALAAVVLLVRRRLRETRAADLPGRVRALVPRGGALLLAVVAALFLFLQFPASSFLYGMVPGFAMVQFPWRLLAYLQVFTLLLVGAGIDAASSRRGVLLGLFLVLTAVGTKSLHPIRYDWFTAADLERMPSPGRSAGLPGIGEFYPRIEPGAEGGARPRAEAFPRELHERTLAQYALRGATPLDGGCTVSGGERREFEPSAVEWTVRCPVPGTVALPLMFSGLERVRVESGAGTAGPDDTATTVRAERTPDDPRIRVRLPAGTHRVRVFLPRLTHLVGD